MTYTTDYRDYGGSDTYGLALVYDRALVLRAKLAQNQGWRRTAKRAGRDTAKIDARVSLLGEMLAELGPHIGKGADFFTSFLSREDIADGHAELAIDIAFHWPTAYATLYPPLPETLIERAWAHIQSDPAQNWNHEMVEALEAMVP